MSATPPDSAGSVPPVIDFSRLWQTGQVRSVEDYLARQYPDGLRVEDLLDLIQQEVLLREARGEAPDPEEYRRRFPAHADQVGALFAVNHLLSRPPCGRRPGPPRGPGLRGRRAARPRRHRRGVPGHRRGARPADRGQGAAAGVAGRPGVGRPVLGRGPDHRPAAAPRRRPALRGRLRRAGAAVHRDEAGRGADAGPAAGRPRVAGRRPAAAARTSSSRSARRSPTPTRSRSSTGT